MPPKPFIHNTSRKLLQYYKQRFHLWSPSTKEKRPAYIRKGRPRGASSIPGVELQWWSWLWNNPTSTWGGTQSAGHLDGFDWMKDTPPLPWRGAYSTRSYQLAPRMPHASKPCVITPHPNLPLNANTFAWAWGDTLVYLPYEPNRKSSIRKEHMVCFGDSLAP